MRKEQREREKERDGIPKKGRKTGQKKERMRHTVERGQGVHLVRVSVLEWSGGLTWGHTRTHTQDSGIHLHG